MNNQQHCTQSPKLDQLSPVAKGRNKHNNKKHKKNKEKVIVKQEHQVFYSDDQDQKTKKNEPHKTITSINNNKQINRTITSQLLDGDILPKTLIKAPFQTHSQSIKNNINNEANIQIQNSIVKEEPNAMEISQKEKSNKAKSPKEKRSRGKVVKDGSVTELRSQHMHMQIDPNIKNNMIQGNLAPQMLTSKANRKRGRTICDNSEKALKITNRTQNLVTKKYINQQRKLTNCERLINDIGLKMPLDYTPDFISFFQKQTNMSFSKFKEQQQKLKNTFVKQRLAFLMQEEERKHVIRRIKQQPIIKPQTVKILSEFETPSIKKRFQSFCERHKQKIIEFQELVEEERSRSRDKKKNSNFKSSLIDSHSQSLQINEVRNQQMKMALKKYAITPIIKEQIAPIQVSFNTSNNTSAVIEPIKQTVNVITPQINIERLKIDNHFNQQLSIRKIQLEKDSSIELEPKSNSKDKAKKKPIFAGKEEISTKIIEKDMFRKPIAPIIEIRKPKKQIQEELDRMSDRKRILASINMLNRKCEQQDNRYKNQERITTIIYDQSRQQREKVPKPKKEVTTLSTTSNVLSDSAKYEQDEAMSDSRLNDHSNRESNQWGSNYSKGQKVKRLQILNRYHFNPFQQNQGEDHCDVWKKLMFVQIHNVRNQYNGSMGKTEQNRDNMFQSLFADAQKMDKCRNNLFGKLRQEDFIVQTNFQPPVNKKDQRTQETSNKTYTDRKGRFSSTEDARSGKVVTIASSIDQCVKTQNFSNQASNNQQKNSKKILYGIEIQRQDSEFDQSYYVKQQTEFDETNSRKDNVYDQLQQFQITEEQAEEVPAELVEIQQVNHKQQEHSQQYVDDLNSIDQIFK